jgi:hypothetical protein
VVEVDEHRDEPATSILMQRSVDASEGLREVEPTPQLVRVVLDPAQAQAFLVHPVLDGANVARLGEVEGAALALPVVTEKLDDEVDERLALDHVEDACSDAGKLVTQLLVYGGVEEPIGESMRERRGDRAPVTDIESSQ